MIEAVFGNCSAPGGGGRECYHFAVCDNATGGCGCTLFVRGSLCSVPSYGDSSSPVGQSWIAVRVIVFVLQSAVLVACVALLSLHAWRRRGSKSGSACWPLPREMAGLLLVAGSAATDIAYFAVEPPSCHQWDLSQAGEAALWALGDLFLAFDCSAYALLAALWLSVRQGPGKKAGGRWGPWVLGACVALPFVTVLACFIIRAVGQRDELGTAQYLFFAVLVALCVAYGVVIVTAGLLTMRSLASAPVAMTNHRKAQLRRVARHVVAAGVVLLLAIVALIVFVTVPLPDDMATVWVAIFAPQMVFFATQLPLVWLFRARQVSDVGAASATPSPTVSAGVAKSSASAAEGASVVSGSWEQDGVVIL